jgi:hypothetical protein
MIMPFLAAAVWLGVAVGSISAAQAGGPLYPTRMWVETALLPIGAEARTAADLNRLDARLAEALSGAARGDRDAVAASLGAYFLIADDAIAESVGDAGLETTVADALDHHQAVLTAIAGRLADEGNATAVDAIERNIQRAIEHNAAVLQTIGNHGNPQGGPGNGTTGNGNGGSGGSGGSPGHTPAPAPTPTAHPATGADKPPKTPKPAPTPQPNHTPRGPGN